MAFTHTTLATLKTELALRLGDSGKVYWSDTELGTYLKEALRTFSAFSSFWRERATFTVGAGEAFYDVSVHLPTLCGRSLKDTDLILDLQYALLESTASQTTWSGTDMFTLDEIVQAIQRRRNQFLADTGVVVSREVKAAGSPPVSRITFTDSSVNIIDFRRIAWALPDSSTYDSLWRTDEWQLNAGARGWTTTPTTPYGYSILSTPPLTIQIAPYGSEVANLDIVEILTGVALNPSTGIALGVPDDLAWIVKWGTLADLLGKDGQARDPNRAALCESRYKLGVELCKYLATVVQAELNGVPLIVDSLHNLDAGYPGWQGSTGTPSDIGTAGLNYIALRPVPDGLYSVTLDVVRRAPIPASDAEAVQLGREQLALILDYAEHLAAFKMGGAEFDATLRQAENFMQQAAAFNQKLAAAALFSQASGDQSRGHEQRYPRHVEARAING